VAKLDAVSAGWIVAAALVINTSAQAFVFAVLPTVGRGIGLSELQTGAVLGLGAVLGMLVAPLWGFASERFGRRPVLLTTMAGVVISPILWATALGGTVEMLPLMFTFAFLLGARCVQAGFGAGLIPTAQAYFADVTTPGRRAAGMGMMSGAISLGTVAGSALVWAFAGFGTLYGFAALATLAALTLVFALLRLPEPTRPETVAVDAHKIPFRTVWPYFIITTLGMTALGMVQPITGLRLMDQFGLPNGGAIGQAGAILTGTSVAMLFSQSVLAVRLGWPPHRMLMVGSIAGLVGITALALTTDYAVLVGAMMVLGAAIGLLLPGNLAAMSLATGVKAQGKVAGINTLAMGVGLVIGPTAGTAIYHASPVAPYWTATVVLIVLALVVFLAAKPKSVTAAVVPVPAE
jgi:MFS transporter, DHA1 family, tetracycline resistance protein